jgi:prepilin-type processing-associated H-X9-DG protein
LTFGALTWLGLTIAAFGWVVPFLAAGGPAGEPSSIAGHILSADGMQSLAGDMILTGFGLAILGALQTGFGALDRFFQAILTRSEARAEAATAASDDSEEAPEIDPSEIVERGRMRDRSYVLFADGSVEVETLLGIRRFTTFDEAAAFVGG